MRRAATALALLVIPTMVLAQAPDDRVGLERFRAELATVGDSATLKAREAQDIERAKQDRDNTLLHLQLGFVAYRLGEVTGDKQHYDDAGSEFEWATDLKGDWPYPWYGLGLSELAMGEASAIAIENLRQVLGKDYLTKAADAFAKAAQADPGFEPALVALGETALRQRVNPRLDAALSALRMAAHHAPGAAVYLQLGRVEREAGSGDSALAAFRNYVAQGGDSGVGLFEVARELYDLGRSDDGRIAYFGGARLARSDEARALYHQDVTWEASPPELAHVDSAAAQGRLAEGLERFWRERDAAAALRRGDALAEHQRRFLYAWRHFRLVSRHRHYDITETYRTDQVTFDDRGVVYLRQGEPDRRAVFTAPGVEPNESWRYDRPSGRIVLHFVARDDVDDYKLVRSVTDILGFTSALQLQSGLTGPAPVPGARVPRAPPAALDSPGQQLSALFQSRSVLDPIYQSLAGGGAAADNLLAEERERGTAAIRIETTTSDYSPHFARTLTPRLEVYALGAPDSAPPGGRLLLVFGLPAKDLQGEALTQGEAYPVEVRVSGVSELGPVLYADTTRVFVARHVLRGSEFLSWALDFPAAAAHHTLHVAVTEPGTDAGALLTVDSVVVPPFGSDAAGFQMSDVVAGRAGSGLVWLDQKDTIALNPLGVYPTGGAVDLYYELFGLARGAGFHARIAVDREGGRSIFQKIAGLFGGGGSAAHAEYDGVAPGGRIRQHQRVSLQDVGPGRYRLTLTVTALGSEARHTRTAELIVQHQ